jgi:hypothetical protein
MAKGIKYEENIDRIEGFTKEFERYLKEHKAHPDHKASVDEVKNSFTYSFATLALSNNSPIQLINVINAIKNRYGKKHLTNEAMGFLDSMIAKAYGYLSLMSRNVKNQDRYRELAMSIFEKAYSEGYIGAISDMMDYKSKWSSEPYRTEDIGLPHVKEDSEIFFSMGCLFVDFPSLVDNASRVLKDKRPVIENKYYFEMAEYKFSQGASGSSSCAVCLGLCQIINGEKEKGLALIKRNIANFRKLKSHMEKILFRSDAEIFDESMSKLETRILGNNKR